jgi:hypothetical protein
MSRTVCGICWCPYDEYTGECACPTPVVRDDTALLRQALDALCDFDYDKRISAVTALRERLGETK